MISLQRLEAGSSSATACPGRSLLSSLQAKPWPLANPLTDSRAVNQHFDLLGQGLACRREPALLSAAYMAMKFEEAIACQRQLRARAATALITREMLIRGRLPFATGSRRFQLIQD